MQTAQEIAADIARELRANPQSWTQKAYDKDGICWCLAGHIAKRCGIVPSFGYFHIPTEYTAPFAKQLGREFMLEWNDDDSRTVEDVIELCERVAAAA